MNLLTQYTSKTLATLAVVLCFGATTASGQGLESSLIADVNTVNLGQIINVNLEVEPESSGAVYTVSANLVYDPSKLEFVSATFGPEWLELNQKELFVTDTINGLIIRTAGYPNGFLGTAGFVKYKFRAKKTGDTRILVASGKAFDENNSDVGIKNTELSFTILGDSVMDVVQVSEEVDYKLKLKIESDTAFYRQDAFPFTIYHKKEKNAQQAITKIWLFDEDWNIHYEDEKLWRSDMDNVLNFVIPADTLGREGNFKIIAKVRYEDGVELDVVEKDVGVLSNGKTWFTKNSHLFMPMFFILVFIALIHHIFTEREIYFKLRNYLKKTRKNKARK